MKETSYGENQKFESPELNYFINPWKGEAQVFFKVSSKIRVGK